jgi:hypothetical protein
MLGLLQEVSSAYDICLVDVEPKSRSSTERAHPRHIGQFSLLQQLQLAQARGLRLARPARVGQSLSSFIYFLTLCLQRNRVFYRFDRWI